MQTLHDRTRFLTCSVMLAMAVATGCGGQEGPSLAKEDDGIVPGTNVTGRVSSCHDGDTCIVKVGSSGSNMKVRMIGIDAPEVSGGDDGSGQPLGKDARAELNVLVKGKNVRVHTVSRDRYERMLGEIYVGDVLVNVEMLKKGMAEAYIWSADDVDASRYRAAEEYAKDHDLGVWSLEDYESPEEFRRKDRESAGL